MKSTLKAKDIVSFKTGKLDSNAAIENGEYPFFTCSQETYKIDKYAFNTECVLLAGNNASGVFPLKYYKGKFNAYQRYLYYRATQQEFIRNTLFVLLFSTIIDTVPAAGNWCNNKVPNIKNIKQS